MKRQRFDLTLAWHNAAFGRVEKMPTLASVLGDDAEPQGDDDMTFNLAAFAASTQVGVE